MAALSGTIQALIAARAKPKIRLVSAQRDRGVTVGLPVNVVIRLQPAKTQPSALAPQLVMEPPDPARRKPVRHDEVRRGAHRDARLNQFSAPVEIAVGTRI